ncbi:MAG: NAD(P)-dependent dehydrogenase, short-chain alcohol dehydrogenase family [Chloroflexi bacterium]|nr:MAG: NAD(P)-dependent dehydrogenase, short-chain alcohol dehydrogenase family [Chloroflexota bacterium]
MGTLDGRNALVTGGGRGIGAAISQALAAEGANVAINYAKRPDPAEEVAASIRAMGRTAEIFQADVSDYEACEAMTTAATAKLGPISILVNNAGIASRGNTVAEGDPHEMERVVRTHVFGSWYMAHLLVPQMRELERGDIVQITSSATSGLSANGSPYNMAKTAQEAFAHTLAKEEMPNGIHVNIVAPGLVDTEMGSRLMRAVRGVESLRELDAESAFGHVCTPQEIASVVTFLCGPGASYVSSQRIYVSGGTADSR